MTDYCSQCKNKEVHDKTEYQGENNTKWNAFPMQNVIKSGNSLSQDAKTRSSSMLKKELNELMEVRYLGSY